VYGAVVLPTLAAGWLPMSTVGAPVIIAKGSAGWAEGVGIGAGGWMGGHGNEVNPVLPCHRHVQQRA